MTERVRCPYAKKDPLGYFCRVSEKGATRKENLECTQEMINDCARLVQHQDYGARGRPLWRGKPLRIRRD